ncbi:MAG: tubulin-like doman-containing protein [Defluviitaleaceae bacterium]|nr:tubulin-like doman-containing protein [Defluviitaleaceae bacterium]
MKQLTHDNIKQMDISLGGGIFAEKTRIDTINHPILVVGLGGTGTDALLRLKYQINRRFKLPDNPMTKHKKQKPDNIEYLSFETNEHDRKKYKGISLDSQEIVLLSNAGIGAILNNRSTLPDYIKKWLSPELTITDGTKGASGNRQAGRLLLFEKINTAVDAIENKIRTLRNDQGNKLLVFLLSGLSGGTGGGMFLDIAYIIRGLMERQFGNNGIDKVEIAGYLFTPDIHLSGNNMHTHTEEYIQRNGYAALKELDYFMNIEERGERFSQKYGTRLEVSSALAPFDLCHLVSACNVDGVFLKDAYDYCMNVTAENIANFLALEDKESGCEFAIQDYLSNLMSNISAMKSNLPHGMSNSANFVYNIVGASAAVLPTEGITSYLAHALFESMEERLFEAEPDENDLEAFAETAGLEINALYSEWKIPPIKLDYAETDYYSYQNVIKMRRVNIDEKLEQQYIAAKRTLSKCATASALKKIKKELREQFLQKGALYVSRLICSDKNPCLLTQIDTYIQQLREKAERLQIDELEVYEQVRLEKARRSILFKREARKNAFIEAKIQTYQARLQKECYVRLIEVYKDIRLSLEKENDTVYAVFAEILREIRRILAQNAAIILEGNQKNHNVVSVNEITDEINAIIEEKDLMREFSKMLLKEAPQWLDDVQISITQSFSSFIYERFGDLLMRPMSDFISLSYGKDRTVEHIAEVEIAPRLFRDAKPTFHMDNTGIFNFPSYGMVSIPANAPDIQRGIESYQKHALSNLRFNIRKSSITDRIFWLNTQNGIPLFAYAPIRVCEELYERTINTKEGVGRHLAMNEQENWTQLPSPIPEKLWGDTYTNPRQKVLNDNARQIFRRGIEAGSIREKDGKYYIGTSICTGSSLEAVEDFFIRCPKLIALTAAENDKKPEPPTYVPDPLTEEFLQILVYEGIVKRGAVYLYEKQLEDDPWPPFVNLNDNADYPEFTMFEKYKSLEPERKELIRAKARANERTWNADKAMINLKKWQGKVAIRKNQLDSEMWKHPNGRNVYFFYRNALLRLNSQIGAGLV